MSNLHNYLIDGDDCSVAFPPFLTQSINMWDLDTDEGNGIKLLSPPINKVCAHKDYFDMLDNSTDIPSKENICTLAISLNDATEAIKKIILVNNESSWGEDYSDEHPLEITFETEKINFVKDYLYKDIFRVYQECIEKNWDGYDAEAVNENVFFESIKFIDSMPDDIQMPEVIPEPTGEIAFEWYKDRKHIFVTSLSGEGIISYAGLFGAKNKSHGTEIFIDNIPNVIISNIKRLI